MAAISWKTGITGDWSTAADWSSGTVPGAGDAVTIAAMASAAGPYTVGINNESESAASLVQNQAQSALAITGGTLTIGGTYAFSAGDLVLDDGTLKGGTLAAQGGTILLENYNNVISGVVLDGTVNLQEQNGASVDLVGDAFHGVGGVGTGTLAIGGLAVSLGNSPTLNNVEVILGPASLLDTDSGNLTIGSTALVTTQGVSLDGSFIRADGDNGGVVNNGTILASQPGARIHIQCIGGGYAGSGTLVASNGGTLTVDVVTFASNGLISIGTGGYVRLEADTRPASIGSFTNNGGTLSLGFALTTAQLDAYATSTGTVGIAGTLTNTGATLTAGAGSPFAGLLLDGGTILGGTVIGNADFAISPSLPYGGPLTTLSAVTFDGPLDLTLPDVSLAITNGLTVHSSSGTDPGTITVTGFGSELLFEGSQTLDNTTVNLGEAFLGSGQDASGDAATLTLGPHVNVISLGAGELGGNTAQNLVLNLGTITVEGGLFLSNATNDNLIEIEAGNDVFLSNGINAGTVTATGGTIEINEGTFVNSGVVSVSGGTGSLSALYGGTFINTGLLTISGGASANLGIVGENLSNTGTIDVSASEVDVGGSEEDGSNDVFTLTQLGAINLSNGAVLGLLGTLTNTGVLALGPGGSIPMLRLYNGGEVLGGTLTGAAASVIGSGGTLTGVTVEGVLGVTSANDDLHLTGGLNATGANGSGIGSIALTGVGGTLTVDDAETIDNLIVSIGATGLGATLTSGNGFGVLTLGSHAIVQQTGEFATLQSVYSTLTNEGRVLAGISGGTLQISGQFSNAGTIAVSNGETLLLNAREFANTGSISVTDGVVDVGELTAADLSTIQLLRSSVDVTGTLDATGDTLNIGRGSKLPDLDVSGTIKGGTLHVAGGLTFLGQATLQDVVVEGALAINRPLADVTLKGSVTLTGSRGSGLGSLSVTGIGDQLIADSSLDNANLSIGSHATSYEGQNLGPAALVSDQQLQLGAHVTIRQTDAYAQIGGHSNLNGSGSGSGTTTSSAAIIAGVAQGSLRLEGESFINAGHLAISNAETVTAGAASFVNQGLISIGAGSALDLDLYNYFADASPSLQSLSNSGTIQMSAGTVKELTDGGAVPNVPLLNAAGGLITGTGALQSDIVNNGTVAARGGELDVTGDVSGAGRLEVDGSATLVLAGVSKGETARFMGKGGVLGLQPTAFLGHIGGFAAGDTIDLLHTNAKSAAFSGKTLVVTLSSGATLHLATTSALKGSLTVTAGANGDSLIRFAGAPNEAPPTALPDAQFGSIPVFAGKVSPTVDHQPSGNWLHSWHTQ